MWPGEASLYMGTSTEHLSMAKGQRGWNRHPLGGFMGEGTSPVNAISG